MNELLKNLGKVSITGEGEWSSNREWERLSVVYKRTLIIQLNLSYLENMFLSE